MIELLNVNIVINVWQCVHLINIFDKDGITCYDIACEFPHRIVFHCVKITVITSVNSDYK